MSRFTQLCLALGLVALLTGCCGGPFARPITTYNYAPNYPVATYGSPGYATSCNCATPAF